jgi:hypothetical protein
MNRKYMDAELKQACSHLANLIAKGSYLWGNPVIMNRACGLQDGILLILI